jgi:hypothetical protein
MDNGKIKAFVLSGIIHRGQRFDPDPRPNPEPIELDPQEYLNLRRAGCVETEAERTIRVDLDRKVREVTEAAKKQADDQVASVVKEAEKKAADARAAADAEAATLKPRKQQRASA